MFVVLIRTVILYVSIIIGLRLLGKRQLGELEPAELTVALILADLASVPMQDNGIPLLTGLIPIAVLLCLTTVFSVLSAKSLRFRNLLCGRPSIVIRNGIVVESEMRRNRLTLDELLEELRIQGHTDLTGIQYAILESNGQLSILPFSDNKPATAAQIGTETKATGLPVVLISDGHLLISALEQQGWSIERLHNELSSHGLVSPEQVFLLTADEFGNTYCVSKGGVG